MYYLYILKLKDGSLYTGITSNLELRMRNHRNGSGSKYVFSKLHFEHIYTESFKDKFAAAKREKQIKSWRRDKKVSILRLRYLS